MISAESICYFSEFSDPGCHSGYIELVFTYTVIVVDNFKYLDAVVKTEIFHPDPAQLWGQSADFSSSQLFQDVSQLQRATLLFPEQPSSCG